MKQGTFKTNTGGVKDYQKARRNNPIFNEPNVRDCCNAEKVIETYFSLLPFGDTDKSKANPLFLTAKTKVTNGV